jgi:hypothetical protein
MEPASAATYAAISIPVFRLAVVVLILAIFLPLAPVLGFIVGSARRRRIIAAGEGVEAADGEATTASFLALLGLLLAFTFGNALTASESIKGAIVSEAAALGTAFLRADYLPEPGKTQLQTALLDYAKTRAIPVGEKLDTQAKAQAFIGRSLELQSRIWPLTLGATRDPVPEPIKTFVAGAVNDALDAHLYRMATLSLPISGYAQLMLFASALAALVLMGNRLGLLGKRLSWRTFLFVVFLGLIMYTIVDLRRGFDGLIRVDGSLMDATILDMERALGGRG